MQFLADTIIEQEKFKDAAGTLAEIPKYKVFFELDANLSFPYADYFLPHDNFWIESVFNDGNIHFGFYINELSDTQISVLFFTGSGSFADIIQGLVIEPINDNGYFKAKVSSLPMEEKYNLSEMLSMFMQALYALNRRDAVSSKASGRKVNIAGDKKNRKKQSYSVISGKRYTSKAEKIIGRKMEWAFAFPVRGHWRKIDGTGKDRHGNYVVKDRTWVKESVKGSGELINKRIIKPS